MGKHGLPISQINGEGKRRFMIQWKGQKGKTSFEVRSKSENKLVVGIDSYVSEIS